MATPSVSRTSLRLLRLIVLLLTISCVGSLSARQWTDKQGRSFEAELHKVTSTHAIFIINGSQRPVPLANLSAADLLYLKNRDRKPVLNRETQPAPEPPPTPPAPVRLQGSFKPAVTQMTADMSNQVRVIEKDAAKRRFIYRTAHFEFISDSYLGTDVVRDFSWVFEVTYDYVAMLPIQLPRKEGPGQQPLRTYLFSTRQAYVRAGASPQSAGVYVPSLDAILVPFSSLGLTRTAGGSYRRTNSMSNRVLQHEITHHLMRGQTQKAAWFIEGVAEYVASIPFSQNRLLLSHHQNAVVDSIVQYGWENQGGYRLGRTIEMPPLDQFMRASYGKFQATRNSYPFALMIFHYFARLEGGKDGAALKAYAELLLQGKTEAEARATLLRGRGPRELEADFARAWNQLGITVKFPRN